MFQDVGTHLDEHRSLADAQEPGRYTDIQFIQSLSYVWLFVTPWAAARQASLSFTVS